MKPIYGILLLAFVVAVPAIADPPDPVAVVAHVLDLSKDQVVAWVDILHAREAAVQPIAQQLQARQQAIGSALQNPNPDPLAIGQAFIEIHALQEQVAAINSGSAAQFEQILTPDQAQRLNAIRGAAQVCPIVPALQATGLAGGQ
jgi:Heavy-metal resistance